MTNKNLIWFFKNPSLPQHAMMVITIMTCCGRLGFLKNLNVPGWQNLKRWNSWQLEKKHAELYFDLFQTSGFSTEGTLISAFTATHNQFFSGTSVAVASLQHITATDSSSKIMDTCCVDYLEFLDGAWKPSDISLGGIHAYILYIYTCVHFKFYVGACKAPSYFIYGYMCNTVMLNL